MEAKKNASGGGSVRSDNRNFDELKQKIRKAQKRNQTLRAILNHIQTGTAFN
jgi:hypothetical protein